MNLTKRQKEIIDFIRGYRAEHGISPTQREIREKFHLSSFGTVQKHLKRLEEKGALKRDWNRSRGISPANESAGARVSLLGLVAAGTPLAATPQDEHLNFSELFGGENHFALKVRGQSMIEDHIDDGDFVVIRQQETANNGERVVAMIDNEVTLKKFNRDNGQVRLEPANGTMQPIIVDPNSDARILGVLVGVLRKC